MVFQLCQVIKRNMDGNKPTFVSAILHNHRVHDGLLNLETRYLTLTNSCPNDELPAASLARPFCEFDATKIALSILKLGFCSFTSQYISVSIPRIGSMFIELFRSPTLWRSMRKVTLKGEDLNLQVWKPARFDHLVPIKYANLNGCIALRFYLIVMVNRSLQSIEEAQLNAGVFTIALSSGQSCRFSTGAFLVFLLAETKNKT